MVLWKDYWSCFGATTTKSYFKNSILGILRRKVLVMIFDASRGISVENPDKKTPPPNRRWLNTLSPSESSEDD